MNYNINVHATKDVRIVRVIGNEILVEVPALHPGGSPRVIDGCAMVEMVVWMNPEESVTTKVTKFGSPATIGNAVTLGCRVARIALYVLVARPEETIPSTGALTDVLNVYGGVVYVGVETAKFGNVVAKVADSEEKNAETAAGVSIVAFGAERA